VIEMMLGVAGALLCGLVILAALATGDVPV
jgi:hypothetical protein